MEVRREPVGALEPKDDAPLGARVSDGVVTLVGRLPESLSADPAVRPVMAVPGVVGATAAFSDVAQPSAPSGGNAGPGRPGRGRRG